MLTVEEAATKWRVSQARVRQWLKDKRIKGANKFGRDWHPKQGRAAQATKYE